MLPCTVETSKPPHLIPKFFTGPPFVLTMMLPDQPPHRVSCEHCPMHFATHNTAPILVDAETLSRQTISQKMIK